MSGGFRSYSYFKLPNKLLMLRNVARQRQIQLLFFPAGMSKRETNQSRYVPRKKTIFWTIELIFHGTGVVLVHHGVDEHASLLSIFEKHLAPGPWNHKLRSFCDVELDDLKLFLQKNPKNSKSPFRKLDMKTSLGSQLAKVMIVEHPIIFVYHPSYNIDFEVEAAITPFLRNTEPSIFEGLPSHNRTSYRVEEVEEGDIPSTTRVTDLMDSVKSAADCIKGSEVANLPSNLLVPEEILETDHVAIHFTDKQIPEETAGGSNHQLYGKTHRALDINSPESGEPGLYFQQELRDAYSELIGEMNPDDFLCLDGVYGDAVDLREERWYDMEERRRVDAEVPRNLGGHEENNDLKEKLADLEEKRENSFLSDRILFGEMELEEGEIPYFFY
ncbi:uncharacterized protein LOC110026897 isoform X2 [Phalaenopsis equestris]|uniref:uncharacterized protein LOC110026897 isoform X2 n=2 Tax=Phalaenopsis equestris TaxID=78828 RepID=UPI0009E5F5A6|nr:uncharacterized protein LOC110026897 isoform X2 [Phalaenopsis equestris]